MELMSHLVTSKASTGKCLRCLGHSNLYITLEDGCVFWYSFTVTLLAWQGGLLLLHQILPQGLELPSKLLEWQAAPILCG